MKRREFVLAGGAGLSVLMASCAGRTGDEVDATEVASFGEGLSITVEVGASADEGPKGDDVGSDGDGSGSGGTEGGTGDGEANSESDDEGDDGGSADEADADDDATDDPEATDGDADDDGEADDDSGDESDADDPDGDEGDADDGESTDDDEGDQGAEDDDDTEDDDTEDGDGTEDGDEGGEEDGPSEADGEIPGFADSWAAAEIEQAGMTVTDVGMQNGDAGLLFETGAQNEEEFVEDVKFVLHVISEAIVDEEAFESGVNLFYLEGYREKHDDSQDAFFEPALSVKYRNDGSYSLDEYFEDVL